MHQHHHHERHGHVHSLSGAAAGSAPFRISILLNLAYVVVEAGLGLYTHSLSLLSDAGHNLSDVASLALSLVAFYLARRRPDRVYTYGYRKSTILAALVNAVILLLAIGMISYEAVMRIGRPQPLPGGTIAWVAGLGILINLGSALLFRKDAELNARSAYLHLMADALISAGVVVAGLIIYFTHWYIVDTLVSLGVAAVILAGTWGLLRGSLRLSLDAVPHDVDLESIRRHIGAMHGVRDFTHIHIWAISTTENALTAHLTPEPGITDTFSLITAIKHELLALNVHHATIETHQELDNGECVPFCGLSE